MTLPQKDKLKPKNLLPRVTHEALQVFACVCYGSVEPFPAVSTWRPASYSRTFGVIDARQSGETREILTT
jgi:hypothetical protein